MTQIASEIKSNLKRFRNSTQKASLIKY